MIVLKLGGASLADAANVANAADHVQGCLAETPLVVVSAMYGITDRLVGAVEACVRGDLEGIPATLEELAAPHREAAAELLSREEAEGFLAWLAGRLDHLRVLLTSMATLHEATPRSRDRVLSLGERLSSRLLAATLRSRGVPSEAVDGEEVIGTDDSFGLADADLYRCHGLATARLGPLVAAGVVPVVMGFVGASPTGETTTLGRGGTDYSAAILAHALDAAEVHFLKEVDGIMSADPRLVPNARRLDTLTYQEVAELSYFGAKVLHPIAIHPLREKRIPARIRSVIDHGAPGTLVVPTRGDEAHRARAVTSIPDVCVITVEGCGMQGVPGIASRVFTATFRARANVLMISQSSSEQSISLVVPAREQARAVAALEEEFELELIKGRLERVAARAGVTVVAVVGSGMRGTPGIAGRVFSALGERRINVILIAQGSSELNISFVIDREDLALALVAVHRIFETEDAA